MATVCSTVLMAFTPGARGYGTVDVFFAGGMNAMGLSVETGGTYMATFGEKTKLVVDSPVAPGMVVAAYAPEARRSSSSKLLDAALRLRLGEQQQHAGGDGDLARR